MTEREFEDEPPRHSILSTLWLDQGEEFIHEQEDALLADVDRLHHAVDARDRHIIDLRDIATRPVLPVRALRSRPLRVLRPLPDGAMCHRHIRFDATTRCAECELPFCGDCMIAPGEGRRPICRDCALIAAGIRTKRHRPHE